MELLSTYLTIIMVMLISYPFVLVGLKAASNGCEVTKVKVTNRFNYGFSLILLIFMIAHIQTETFYAAGLLEMFKPE
ncbi:NrfF protein [Vibrio vulnificus]|uniref:NrfF protein n=1 Tax=Vibrio vulnificus TaxID=672 RepID=UPI000CD249B2|nr:NrfF protein [Vibrio vulnificus]EGR0099827.1 NrfF protein [Vibrio vulnificus]EGS1995565.1 NrfF protein [Vibrio vulnificus]EHD2234924.1 NrfF protein [Vibrio vulnificus]EHK9066248.1 NrfF protein [Vibrio vulnificus]EHT4874506.1 NrfF protein [Vibrio vulnificus]